MKNPSLQNKKIKCLVCGTEYDLSKQHCPKCKYPALTISSDKPGQKRQMINALKAELKIDQRKNNEDYNRKPAETSGCSFIILLLSIMAGCALFNIAMYFIISLVGN